MKQCSICKKILPDKKFYRRKNGKLLSRCISCRREIRKQLSEKLSIEERKGKNRQIRMRKYKQTYAAQCNSRASYKVQWVSYFIERHGYNPACQICGKKLKWGGFDKRGNVVHFDHKNRLSSIKGMPSGWINIHLCSPKNIATWEQCNFGILCLTCNRSLPTDNREEWLNKALQYTQKHK